MSSYVGVRVLKQEEKEARRAQLQALVDEIRAERKEKKKQKRRKKKEEKRRKKVCGDWGMVGLFVGWCCIELLTCAMVVHSMIDAGGEAAQE